MPFIKDLGQMEDDFSVESFPGKDRPKKKVFKTVRLPLSILGDKMPKIGDTIVAVTVGKIKGFENTEHTKELMIEAMSGGVYMKTANLESQIAAAFGKKDNPGHTTG